MAEETEIINKKELKRQYDKQYRLLNSEYERQIHKKYYLDHKELIKEKCRQRYANNPEQKKIQVKQYHLEHKEQMKQFNKQWFVEHPERMKILNGRKNAHRKNLEFEPLNKSQKGYEAHHINLRKVIYMSKELHRGIKHNVITGKNMHIINAIAVKYLTL